MGDCFHGKDLNILVIGLNSAGKSTLINKLKPEICQQKEVRPTNGFETPWIPFRNYCLRFRDMGGASNYRPLWQNHVEDLHGIIFVIDSSDSTRFSTAAEELHAVCSLSAVQARPIPILVFANKNDLEESAPKDVIERSLRLNEISNHVCNVMSVCSQYSKDILQGIEWLVMRQTVA